MNIGIDARGINLYKGSGIGTYTRNLIFNLINSNLKDKFNLLWTGNEDKNFIKNNTSLTFISGRYNSFYEDFYIPHWINEKKLDLYHLPQNGLGMPLDSNSKIVVTIHDLIPYAMPETVGKGYLDKFLKEMPKIISSCSGIITVSEYSKNDILRFFPNFPSEKIYVTPLAANESFKPIEKESCKNVIKNLFKIDSPFILYLGGFSSRKNVKSLILAFKKIIKDLPNDYKLVLGGTLQDEGFNLQKIVIDNNLENNVIFTGYLKDSLLPIFYNAADVFVYPSYYEGFGLPPLEAMCCKTPVITSNLTSIPEVTNNAALLINPSNEDELSDALIKILKDDYLRKELSEKGYLKSLEFSWKKTCKLTYDAYLSILNSD